jgi:Zn-dependent peptidase ImmA (M78 family)
VSRQLAPVLLLGQEATLLKYPINDDELCAFVCKKKNRIFVYINTYIPKEKQIFAAAHELYHIWFDQERLNQSELLQNRTLENDTQDLNELKANLFAAMLLVPTNILQSELTVRQIQKQNLKVEDIVKLMSLFNVPYKALIRRLYEIEFITDKQLNRFLSVPDRDSLRGVLLTRRKLQLSDTTQDRTKEIFFEQMVENAIQAFEQKKITGQKLRYILSLVNQAPENYQILLSSEDYWDSIMEDYDGDD